MRADQMPRALCGLWRGSRCMRRFWPAAIVRSRYEWLACILCPLLLTLLLLYAGFGEGLSFDLPFQFGPTKVPDNVVIVTMDESAYDDPELNPSGFAYPNFDRATHARFLKRLTADGAPLVVFDIFFKDPKQEDALFAAAITNHGNVILAAEL